MKNARTEVPELNGLRALAALAVMLCHAKIVFDHARWATVVARWARSGWLGVDLFFVLSGYLLTRGLYEWREGPHYYRRFYARRVARIFPLYYLYLAGVFAVAARVALPPHLFAPRDGDLTRFAVYLGNAVYAERWPGLLLAPLWSLAVEEHFYLVWPAAFRRLTDAGVVRVTLAVAGVAALARWAVFTGAPDLLHAVYTLTPCRVDALFVGAALAALAHAHGDARVVAGCRAHVGVALAWLAIVALTPLDHHDLEGAYVSTPFVVAGGAVTAAACAVLVGAVRPGAPPVAWLRSRALVHVGKVSYGVYLLHTAVGGALYALAPRSWRTLPLEAWFAAWVACTVLVATVVYRLVEAPILALRRRLPWER